MKDVRSKIAKKFLIRIIVAIMVASVAVNASDPSDLVDWDNASPREIHEELWRSKVRAHLDQDYFQRLSGMVENTQTNYDIKFYDVDIRVNDTTEIIYGVVRFVATAVEDDLTAIQIDFQSGMTTDSIVAPTGQLSYGRAGDVVTLNLDKAYSGGEQFEFEFHYHGHPTEAGFQAFAFDTRFGIPVISSLSEPYFARSWWPCKDRMDDKADSFHIALTVDTAFYVGSNGSLDSTVPYGTNAHTFYYSVGYPMAAYLFSVAISVYTVWYDEWTTKSGATMPIVHAVYPDKYAYSLTRFNITPNAISIFSDAFGEYPFANEKYGHANFEWGGAMEHQTMSSMSGSSFGFSTPVVVHELGHQWWGDMITCKSWGHIWLNEGWASYSEAIYYEAIDGWQGYHDYMEGMEYGGAGTIFISDTDYVWNIFGSIVYDKGAWVCHMLRGVLGDSLFFVGVDAYYNSEYQHAAANTEEFRDVIEQATGVELDWFFEQWIYGTYRPNYRWSFWQDELSPGVYDLFIHVRQRHSSAPLVFEMPADFQLDYVTLPDDTVRFTVNQRSQNLKLIVSDSIVSITLDPSDWILKYGSAESWTMHIVTFEGELSSSEQLALYDDTIQVRGGSNDRDFNLLSGELPSGYAIDNDGIITGSTPDTGQFNFLIEAVDNLSAYRDSANFTIYVAPLTGGLPGDVDVDGELSILDVLYLVSYLFQQGESPVVMHLADVDASCDLSILDVIGLVDYLFRDGPPPQAGCA